MSRSSRALMSARTAASSTASPRPLSSRIAAPCPLFGRRGYENLNLGLRRDHGSDVAPVDHGAGLRTRKFMLQCDQSRPHLRNGRDDRRGFRHLVRFQVVFRKAGRIVGLRRSYRRSLVVEPADLQHREADAPVEQAAVEMPIAVMGSETLGDGALAGSGRAVDGDDHDNSAPSPRINSTKPGKLVAINAASSTPTGCSLASPITSADIASR